MINFFENEILGLAYRKAKYDLFYSTGAPISNILRYEKELHENLSRLCEKLNGDDMSWIKDPEYLGSWYLAEHKVDIPELKEQNNGLIFSSPSEELEQLLRGDAQKSKDINFKNNKTASFRLMSACSIDFHVVSALWIIIVGQKFDLNLTKNAYGNRLRRMKNGKSFNKYAPGSFKHYIYPYREWRMRGLQEIKKTLEGGKKVTALTGDIDSFYHSLSPMFMLDEKYIKNVAGVKLSPLEIKLNRIFINSIKKWASTTPLKIGLPVGVPASAIIANMALIELDRIIETQVVPLYYGRYVDDIFLVMENTQNHSSKEEVWEWIAARSEGKLEPREGTIFFNSEYFKHGESKCEVKFGNTKNKTFFLTSETGEAMIRTIIYHMNKQISEWQALPSLPFLARNVRNKMFDVTQRNGEIVDNLRKADSLVLRRANFALMLRDFETYCRDLPSDTWKSHRSTFLKAFIEYIMVLPHFFEISRYLPRVIKMATYCGDIHEINGILVALKKVVFIIKEHFDLEIKSASIALSKETILEKWTSHLYSMVRFSIISAFPINIPKEDLSVWDKLLLNKSILPNSLPASITKIRKLQENYFSFDLAHTPYRYIGLPQELVDDHSVLKNRPPLSINDDFIWLPKEILDGVMVISKWLKRKSIPHGLAFPTRPYSIPELYIIKNQKHNDEDMRVAVLAMRGHGYKENIPKFEDNVLSIPHTHKLSKQSIGVTSWKTNIESWQAAVSKQIDPDSSRYTRLCTMIEGVFEHGKHCRYLILPELSLPARWFMSIALRLQKRGVSLIAGIEYLHGKRSCVSNQVWALFSSSVGQIPLSYFYKQDKQYPALHEDKELRQAAGLELVPIEETKTPTIIAHGDFRFSILICSELTNIEYRASLRGKIDALFIPEWNQDTEHFNSLVESAASDIHAYIIQCNNREYGDSRIRAPFKDAWLRDVLRVKGGITDYVVIGEIDIQSLRQFQSCFQSPERPFKPVPDGFIISPERKCLPKIDK